MAWGLGLLGLEVGSCFFASRSCETPASKSEASCPKSCIFPEAQTLNPNPKAYVRNHNLFHAKSHRGGSGDVLRAKRLPVVEGG